MFSIRCECIDRRIRQMDAAVDKTTRRGRASSVMALIERQRARRLGFYTVQRLGDVIRVPVLL